MSFSFVGEKGSETVREGAVSVCPRAVHCFCLRYSPASRRLELLRGTEGGNALWESLVEIQTKKMGVMAILANLYLRVLVDITPWEVWTRVIRTRHTIDSTAQPTFVHQVILKVDVIFVHTLLVVAVEV